MLKAIEDRIIIKPDKMSSSKLIIQDDNKNVVNQGVVKSIGDKVTLAQVGDYVVFHRFDELPLPLDDLIVVREKSLLGKYTK
ncbi:MAG: hypothetical protein Q4D80_02555 [Pseudomonadota bacterium]|nr:hypothetical protein [Pseudomonadota bacterium]